MDFCVTKVIGKRDKAIGLAQGVVFEMVGRRAKLLSSRNGLSGTGASGNSNVSLGLVAVPSKWRVMGVGGYVFAGGASTVQESMTWGYKVSDLGGQDLDAFGSVVCVATENKELVAGDILYQGIAPFETFFGFDALANAGAHVWDIAGADAGVMMGDWQTKAVFLTATKVHVGSSTATIAPFILLEWECYAGVEKSNG